VNMAAAHRTKRTCVSLRTYTPPILREELA
jgi:hypothetical protein